MGSLLAKLGISALLLWLLIRGLDAERLLAIARRVDPLYAGFAVALLATVPAISAPRWHAILLRLGHALSFGSLARALYVGSFFSQALPSSIGGDFWRVWYCTRAGVPLAAAMNSVLIERMAGLAASFICFAVLLPLLLAKLGDAAVTWGVWTVFAVCGGGAAALFAMAMAPGLAPRSSLWVPLSGLARALAAVSRSGRLVSLMLSSAFVGQIVAILAVFALARSLALPLGLIDCALVVPPSLLVALLPISLGGWGVREGALVAILGPFGIGREEALVLSILFGLALFASSLPGLALWLGLPAASPRSQP